MIVVFGGEKGGTGKTTIATNIAVELAFRGRDVLLMDTDRQESSSAWCLMREEENIQPRIPCLQKFGGSVRQELSGLKNRYTDIIVDCGGRDSVEFRSALLVADMAVIPLRPAQFDLWTVSKFRRAIEEVKLINENIHVRLLLNAANTPSSVMGAKMYLTEFDDLGLFSTVVTDGLAFHRSAAEGRSVRELMDENCTSSYEISALYKEIFG